MNNEMNHAINKSRANLLKLAKMAMLGAISIVLVWLIHFPIIPGVTFLEYDPADIPILIAAFAFGPLAGVTLTVVVSLIQGFTVSAVGGVYGIIMHIIATSTLVLVAGGVYRSHKTRKTAVIGLILGVLSMTAVMCVANLFITPLYMTVPREVVMAMLPTVIIPFNLIKAGANALLTFLLYKRISSFLHKN